LHIRGLAGPGAAGAPSVLHRQRRAHAHPLDIHLEDADLGSVAEMLAVVQALAHTPLPGRPVDLVVVPGAAGLRRGPGEAGEQGQGLLPGQHPGATVAACRGFVALVSALQHAGLLRKGEAAPRLATQRTP
jgi:hypothetical protein